MHSNIYSLQGDSDPHRLGDKRKYDGLSDTHQDTTTATTSHQHKSPKLRETTHPERHYFTEEDCEPIWDIPQGCPTDGSNLVQHDGKWVANILLKAGTTITVLAQSQTTPKYSIIPCFTSKGLKKIKFSSPPQEAYFALPNEECLAPSNVHMQEVHNGTETQVLLVASRPIPQGQAFILDSRFSATSTPGQACLLDNRHTAQSIMMGQHTQAKPRHDIVINDEPLIDQAHILDRRSSATSLQGQAFLLDNHYTVQSPGVSQQASDVPHLDTLRDNQQTLAGPHHDIVMNDNFPQGQTHLLDTHFPAGQQTLAGPCHDIVTDDNWPQSQACLLDTRYTAHPSLTCQQKQLGPHHRGAIDDIHDMTSSEDETEEEPSSMERTPRMRK